MYNATKFQIDDPKEIGSFIGRNPYGVLISCEWEKIYDSVSPFIQDDRGHLIGCITTKNNPHWKAWGIANHVKIIFMGPQAHASPRFDFSEISEPVWDYAAISVSGKISVVDGDQQKRAFLNRLVTTSENANDPWRQDGNDECDRRLVAEMVVFSVSIESVSASFNLNQHKRGEDQRKLIQSLSGIGSFQKR